MCVCVRVRVCACVHVCVCVRVRTHMNKVHASHQSVSGEGLNGAVLLYVGTHLKTFDVVVQLSNVI